MRRRDRQTDLANREVEPPIGCESGETVGEASYQRIALIHDKGGAKLEKHQTLAPGGSREPESAILTEFLEHARYKMIFP